METKLERLTELQSKVKTETEAAFCLNYEFARVYLPLVEEVNSLRNGKKSTQYQFARTLASKFEGFPKKRWDELPDEDISFSDEAEIQLIKGKEASTRPGFEISTFYDFLSDDRTRSILQEYPNKPQEELMLAFVFNFERQQTPAKAAKEFKAWYENALKTKLIRFPPADKKTGNGSTYRNLNKGLKFLAAAKLFHSYRNYEDVDINSDIYGDIDAWRRARTDAGYLLLRLEEGWRRSTWPHFAFNTYESSFWKRNSKPWSARKKLIWKETGEQLLERISIPS